MSSQDDKDRSTDWGTSTIGQFDPDRRLTRTDNGQLEFRTNAGPIQAFGAGPRGCFGELDQLCST